MKELLAVKAHRPAGLALHPTAVEPDELRTETLETPDSYEAAQLSEADLTTLQQQYRKLAALKKTPKRSESPSYVPTTIIMNVLSLADAKAHPLPNDRAVGWFLNPIQHLFGGLFARSLEPDIVAYLVPRKTAEDCRRLPSTSPIQNHVVKPERSPPSLGPNDHCGRRSARPDSPNSSIISELFVAIGPSVLIAKIYWADAGSKWNEGCLYQDAHGDVKIPGLVRVVDQRVVDHWKMRKVVSGSRKPGGPITKREQVCVILDAKT